MMRFIINSLSYNHHIFFLYHVELHINAYLTPSPPTPVPLFLMGYDAESMNVESLLASTKDGSAVSMPWQACISGVSTSDDCIQRLLRAREEKSIIWRECRDTIRYYDHYLFQLQTILATLMPMSLLTCMRFHLLNHHVALMCCCRSTCCHAQFTASTRFPGSGSMQAGLCLDASAFSRRRSVLWKSVDRILRLCSQKLTRVHWR
jgi:hypothetical protein